MSRRVSLIRYSLIRSLEFEIFRFGIWNLGFGIWNLRFSDFQICPDTSGWDLMAKNKATKTVSP